MAGTPLRLVNLNPVKTSHNEKHFKAFNLPSKSIRAAKC